MNNKESLGIVKVPVFITEIIESPEELFGGISMTDMNKFIIRKAEEFNTNGNSIVINNRSRSKSNHIHSIEVTEIPLGKYSGILVKISAFTTNLLDGYYEANTKIPFEKHDKVGSDNNYLFIYPYISGLIKGKYQHNFIILLYEDPNKLNDDFTKIAKHTLNKIFGIRIRNIKIPTLLEELYKMKLIPTLQVKLVAVTFDDEDVSYKEYLVTGETRVQKTNKYENMPIALADEIIRTSDLGEYNKMEINITQGRKEYRIYKQLEEAKGILHETAEKLFNSQAEITQHDLENKIYDKDFIMKIIQPVLENYLSSDIDN